MKKVKKVYVVEIRFPFRQIVVEENLKQFKRIVEYCKMNGWEYLAYTQII